MLPGVAEGPLFKSQEQTPRFLKITFKPNDILSKHIKAAITSELIADMPEADRRF